MVQIKLWIFFRYEKLVTGAKKYDVEGLNSLEYKIHYLEKKILYTWVLVEIKQESVSQLFFFRRIIYRDQLKLNFFYEIYRAADESFHFHFYLIKWALGVSKSVFKNWSVEKLGEPRLKQL